MPIREDRKTPMHDLIIRGARVFDLTVKLGPLAGSGEADDPDAP